MVEIMNAAKKHEIRGCTSWARTPRCPIRTSITRVKRSPRSITWWCRTSSSRKRRISPMSCCPPPRGPKIGTVTNTDRMVQLGRKAIDPPGDARPDFWILNELARRVGVDWYYEHPREVFDEMRTCMDSIAGITWDRLERDSSVTYPCVQVGDPGDPSCSATPSRPNRDGRFVPADLITAAERPDAEY